MATMRTGPEADLSGFTDPTMTVVGLADADGDLIGWSGAAEELFGLPAEAVMGKAVNRILHRGAGASPWGMEGASRLGKPEMRTVQRPDGARVRVTVRILPLRRHGPDRMWVLLAAEADGRRRWMTDQLVLAGLFTQSPILLTVYDADTRVLWVNDVLRKQVGVLPETVIGRTNDELLPQGTVVSSQYPRGLDEIIRSVASTGEPVFDLVYRSTTPASPEHYHVWSCSYFRLQDPDGKVLGVCESAFDVSERYESQTRLKLLGGASRIGTTLDATRTAQELGAITVPDFADRIQVRLSRSALSGGQAMMDAGSSELVTAVERSLSHTPGDGRPVLGAVVRPDGPEGERKLVLPLVAGEKQLGTVELSRAAPRLPFNDEDRALAEELVSRTAICVDNARRFVRERGIALTLQQTLLPRTLPEVAAVQVAHRYMPASGRLGVGGDWYDVIPLSGARVGLVVGDVVGHGLNAAATMGRLRTTVQALAGLDLSPDELLARLNDLVGQTRIGIHRTADNETEDLALGATCLYAVYDPASRILTVASAGHLPPVITSSDGEASPLDLPVGPPLGVGSLPFECLETELSEGSLVSLFTDGLVEARDDDIDEGVRKLCRLLDDPSTELEATCDAITSARSTAAAEDDAALLVMRVHGLPDSSTASWQFACDPAEVATARSLASRQVSEWDMEDLCFLVELVVSELVTNAIRYGGAPVGLRLLKGEDHALICEVSDGGHTSPRLRRAADEDEGGRGLFLVAQLTERWGTRYDRLGKTIWTEMRAQESAPLDLFALD